MRASTSKPVFRVQFASLDGELFWSRWHQFSDIDDAERFVRNVIVGYRIVTDSGEVVREWRDSRYPQPELHGPRVEWGGPAPSLFQAETEDPAELKIGEGG